jgi:tetratricopeptide (TPR) repeat protein
MPTRFILTIVALHTFLFPLCGQTQSDDPAELRYWVNRYALVTTEDSLAKRAHQVFHRLMRVADKRINLSPQLFVLQDVSSLKAFSLPNGPVVINYQVLNFCNSVPTQFNERLAFILAHELSHQLNGDFWHLNFFTEIEKDTQADRQTRERLRNIGRQSAETRAKELRADHYAILYMTLAGFSTAPLTSPSNNLISEWYAQSGLDVQGYGDLPRPKDRIEVVNAKLHFLFEELESFECGLYLYRTLKFKEAAAFFEAFKVNFPSREVFNDLGLAYFMEAQDLEPIAVASRQKSTAKMIWSTQLENISILASPQPSGYRGPRKREVTATAELESLKTKSIENLEECVRLDPYYANGFNNLGCVLDYAGRSFEAIGRFDQGLKLSPKSVDLLNNRAVALFHADRKLYKEALNELAMASRLGPHYAPAAYNSGVILSSMGKTDSANKCFTEFLNVSRMKPWNDYVRDFFVETAENKPKAERKTQLLESASGFSLTRVAAIRDEIEKRGQTKTIGTYDYGIMHDRSLGVNLLLVVRRGVGISSAALITVDSTYTGHTTRGISIGDSSDSVFNTYGLPDRVMNEMSREFLIFVRPGIGFEIRDNKVLSWYLF